MEQATADGGVASLGDGAGGAEAAMLDHLVTLRALGWRHAMALKDARNQVAMLERETTRGRAALEQFLAVTLASLDEARASLLTSEAERAALSDRLRLQTNRNRRLITRGSALAAELRAKAAEADELRRERAATLADAHFQVRMLTARIGVLETRLAEAESRDRAGQARAADAEDPLGRREDALRRQAETEAALAAALRREENLRSERSRSRWIALGRGLGLTKL